MDGDYVRTLVTASDGRTAAVKSLWTKMRQSCAAKDACCLLEHHGKPSGSGEAAVDATWDMKRWRKRVFEVLERDAVTRHRPAPCGACGPHLLILGNAAGAVLETVPEIDTEYRIELHLFEMFSFLAFSTEYALRLWAAPEHPRFGGFLPPRRAFAMR